MTIEVFCPKCHRTYKVADEYVGRTVVCKNSGCHTKFTVSELAVLPEESKLVASTNTPIVYGVACIVLCGIVGLACYLLSRHEKTGSAAPAPSSSQNSDRSDTLEIQAFRKAITKTVLFANLVGRRFEKHAAADYWMLEPVAQNSLMILDEQRSRIPVPPPGIDSREVLQQQLDSLVNEMKEIVKHFKPSRPKTEFNSANEALQDINADAWQLPAEVKSRLATIDRTAKLIADELKISDADAHGADRFQKQIHEYDNEAHALLKSIDAYQWTEMFPSFDLHEFTVKWSYMVDPPKGTVEGKEIVQDFSGLFRSVHNAIRIVGCLSHLKLNRKTNDIGELHRAFDQELQKAKQFLADAESRIAKTDQR